MNSTLGSVVPLAMFVSCYCSDAHNNADPKDLSNALLPCGLSLVYEAFLEDNAFSLKKNFFNWREQYHFLKNQISNEPQ